jgi:predicted TIM-barrel fold metal-dependent hydrolase
MRAIDVHVHPGTEILRENAKPYMEAMQKYYKFEFKPVTEEEMANKFREAGQIACIVAFDAETATGLPPVTNDYIAQMVKDFPDVFVGWAGVDPLKGKMAIEELERANKEFGFTGVKFAPHIQQFFLDDPQFYPLWEKCVELDMHMMTHTGFGGLGAGLPGGLGTKLQYVKPFPHIDNLAADFPELTIVAAHPAWPWTEEFIAVVLHKGNVFWELSGWAPRYYPQNLFYEANRRFQDKIMYGSDYPAFDPNENLNEFMGLDWRPGVLEKLVYKNAQRILGICKDMVFEKPEKPAKPEK